MHSACGGRRMRRGTDMDDVLTDARETALSRYDMLRARSPAMFEDGPMPIVDPRRSRHAGVAYLDPWIMLVVDAVAFPDGRIGEYTRLRYADDRGNGVAVLPVTDDGVVLLRNWRHATRSWHLEIPRGFGEPDAQPVQQARQELLEETALDGRLVPLGTVHPDTGVLSFAVDLYAAVVGDASTARAEDGLSDIVRLTTDQMEDAVMDGRITDGFTLAAWLRWTTMQRAKGGRP